MPVVVHGPLHDFRFFKIALNVRTTMAELQLEMGGNTFRAQSLRKSSRVLQPASQGQEPQNNMHDILSSVSVC